MLCYPVIMIDITGKFVFTNIYLSVLENLQCYNVILTEVKSSSHLKTESNFDNQLLNHFEL